MLHIILMILKILGIILLALLGILLLLLLEILFVPVCYQAYGCKEGEILSVKTVVSWLFHLIHVRFIYEEKKAETKVFLCGIPLSALKKRKKISEKSKHTEEKHTTEETAEENVKETVKETVEETKTEPLKTEENKPGKTERKHKKTEKVKEKGIMEKLRKIRLTFRRFCDKMKQWRTFIKNDNTKQTIRFVLSRCKRLLRHILPRKIRGKIRFGMKDPCTTGEILAVAGICYPIYKNSLQLTPVFDEEILEGEIKLRGRIYVCCLLWTAWKIFINKEVRVTYQRFQHKEA